MYFSGKLSPGYRPRRRSIPEAVARIAMTVPIPEKLRWRMWESPVAMSQIPNNNTPMLLFIAEIPFMDN
jgi:hypothetical protein